MNVPAVLRRMLAGDDLSEDDARALFGDIMDGDVSPVQSAGLLAALAAKGETRAEIVGAARAMRQRSEHVAHGLPLVADVVGTGGDGANTINISTLAALTVAACGVPVAKHGNRAASSACGSADVLEAAGMRIDASPELAANMLREHGFTFMFAPHSHPAMKNVAPVRRELGVRTIFNVLGPLTNPARATHAVVGVAREAHVELIGEVLQALGARAGAVVHAQSGMDEIAGDGPTLIYAFAEGAASPWTLDPVDFGVAASPALLRGESVAACRQAFDAVLGGERSPRTDVVALNAALALRVCGQARRMEDAFELARDTLHAGRAGDLFERVKAASHG